MADSNNEEEILGEEFYDDTNDTDAYTQIIDSREEEVMRENNADESEDSEFDVKRYEKNFVIAYKMFDYLLSYEESSRKYVNVKYNGKEYRVKPLLKFKKSGKYVVETIDKVKLTGYAEDFEMYE